MAVTFILGLIRKLPWKVLGPVVVILALALCVRERVQANARADAYARVAAMTAKYSQQQEQERQRMKKESDDSIAVLKRVAAEETRSANVHAKRGKDIAAALRSQLQGEQRMALDSMEYNFNSALWGQQTVIASQQSQLNIKDEQLKAAEQRIAGLTRENKVLQDVAKAEAKRSSTTGWKVATAIVGTVGVVAYATKH
jgi:hypothetical protein